MIPFGIIVKWKNWDCHKVDLTKYIGKKVTIEFVTADCAQVDHFGYGYFDMCVDDNPSISISNDGPFCLEDDGKINMSGSNYDTHDLFIFESDANGNEIREISKSLKRPGLIKDFDLSPLIKALDGEIKCDQFYLVKVIARNHCATVLQSRETLVQYSCPDDGLEGDDECCLNWSCVLNLGAATQSQHTYTWTMGNEDANGVDFTGALSSTSVSNPVFDSDDLISTPSSDRIIYNLNVVDENGCDRDYELRIDSDIPNFTVSVDTQCCGFKLVPTETYEGYDYTWEIISPTSEILADEPILEVAPDVVSTYKLTITNACGSSSQTVTLDPFSIQMGPLDALTFSTELKSDDIFQVFYIEDPANPNSRYNATYWEIQWFNRWGESNWGPGKNVASGKNCNGFANGDIKWDLKVNGQRIPSGVYMIKLIIKNCDVQETGSNHYDEHPAYTVMGSDIQCHGMMRTSWKRLWFEHNFHPPMTSDADCYWDGDPDPMLVKWQCGCTTANNGGHNPNAGRTTWPLGPIRQCECTGNHDVQAWVKTPITLENYTNTFLIRVD